jgi:hypothetical protein
MTNKRTSVAGHFDGHAEAMKQYMRHRPMQHVQGYSGSHWTLSSGDCSLLTPYCPGDCQGDNQQNNNGKCTHFAGVHRPMEEVQGFHKSH